MTREEATSRIQQALNVPNRLQGLVLIDEESANMAIEALQADVVSREEAIQAVDKCRERKNKEIEQLREFYSHKPTIPMFAESEEAYKAWTGEEMGGTSDLISRNDAIKVLVKEATTDGAYGYIDAKSVADILSALPNESAEAYKAWTGEEMGGASDEINEMNKEIIKDILKMMPTAYLLEALGVSTFEELTEPADRPTGEWKRTLEDLESGFVRCNRCDTQFDYYEITQLAQESCEKDFPNYCPNCGAKMGGDGE